MSWDINILKEKIKKHMSNTFLDSHLKEQHISDDQLYMLHHLFMLVPELIHKKEPYIITTLLVQAALDTHDSVTRHNIEVEGEQAEQSTQLTVLAGDYYSGMYYLILSNTEDIDFIRVLAYAIKEINELKMELYHSQNLTFSEFVELYGQISVLLIKETARFIGLSEDILEVMDTYLQAIVFLEEAENTATNRIYDIWIKGNEDISKELYNSERDKYIGRLLKDLPTIHKAPESELNLLFEQATRRYRQYQRQQPTREEG